MSGLPFPFGPPPSPEQIEEARKSALALRASDESKYRAMLPPLYAARDALREARAVGAGGRDFSKVYRRLAAMIEGVELQLRGEP